MTLATNILPYGLRDVKLFAMDDTGAYSAGVDLPAAQTFSFSEAEDFQTLRGDDGVISIRGKGPTAKWKLESGGISLAAYKIIAGGTLGTTGSTPNQVRTFNKKTTDTRPYFGVMGMAISDSGGNMHGVLYKCRASDDLEGEWADGTFWISKCGGEAIGDSSSNLYDFRQFETATNIPSVFA